MYLGLSVCARCQGTEDRLEEALSEVARVLEPTGAEMTVRKIHVQSEEQAQALGFVSSPTIRINRRDIQQVRGETMDVRESPCECGGALYGVNVDCRDWVYQGKEYTIPPQGLIIDAILREVYSERQEAEAEAVQGGEVPDNLKRFFAAKRQHQAGVDQQENLPSKGEDTCCEPSASSGCCG